MTHTHTIFLACACILLTIGCAKNSLDEVVTPLESATTIVSTGKALSKTTVEQGLLVFESKEHMDQALRELMQMPTTVRQQWYDQKDFISLDALYDAANEEINNMVSRADYDAVCAKYADVFLFHTADSRDLPPYLRVEECVYTPLLNRAGCVKIAGQQVDLNVYSSVERTDRYQREQQYKKAGKAISSSPNKLFIEDGKRKYWAESCFTTTTDIYVRVGCQVRSFWGWNSFRQSYWFAYDFTTNDKFGAENKFTQIGADFHRNGLQSAIVSDSHMFYFGTRAMIQPMSGQPVYASRVDFSIRTSANDGPTELGILHVTTLK